MAGPWRWVIPQGDTGINHPSKEIGIAGPVNLDQFLSITEVTVGFHSVGGGGFQHKDC